MIKKLFLACAIIACATGSAVAEPVSLIAGLSAVIFNAGLAGSVGGALAVATFAVNTTIGLALSVGLSFASKALMGQKGTEAIGAGGSSQGLNAPDVRYNERQSIPSKRIVVGTAQVGGALFYEQVKAPYLTQGILICAREISEFRKCWIGTNEISFANFTPNTILTPFDVEGQPDYPNRLKVSVRVGSDAQTIDPLIAQDYTNVASTFRQQGIATAVLRYHYGADYTEFTGLWGNVQKPNPLFLVDGVFVYDPRDKTQSATDRSTWKFTNNATLIQTYYLTQSFGGRIPTSKIDYDKVAISADWDDGLVACKDGTFIKRHTIDGVFNLSQSPSDVLRGMLSANRGRVLESGGRIWVASSYPKTPVATIYDAILTGGIEFRSAKPKRDLVNRCKVRLVSEEREYQTTDGPVLSRVDLQEEDGEILDATLELPFTLDHRRAQRLQKAYLDSARLGKTITCQVDVSIMCELEDELVGSAVTFDSELFAQANGTYFVTDVGFDQSFSSIELALVEYDPDIEIDWDCNKDEQDFELATLDVT